MEPMNATWYDFSSLSCWLMQIASTHKILSVSPFRNRLRASSQFFDTLINAPSHMTLLLRVASPFGSPHVYDKASYPGFSASRVMESLMSILADGESEGNSAISRIDS